MRIVADQGERLAPFKTILLRTCGLYFQNEREKTLHDGLARRMAQRGIATEAQYLALLEGDGDEFQQLVELLTVNETYFFREPEHLKLVVDTIVPEIIAQRKAQPVRILSAGCSTGEEPYSIAMMLRERFGPDSEHLFTIAGVDIDASALGVARRGVYGPGSFRGVDPSLRERYFTPCGHECYELGEIRRQVRFEVANLLGPSYPAIVQKPDIIFYRNVSIYFPSQVQREIFGRLAALLDEGGYLFVGASETVHHDIGVLTLTERNGLFFYRKMPRIFIGERRLAARRPFRGEPPCAPPAPRAPTPPTVAQLPSKVAARTQAPRCAAEEAEIRRLFGEALELAKSARTQVALNRLDLLIDKDPSFIRARSLKGSVLVSASRFEEARRVCTEILERDPFCLVALLILGITARHEGAEDEARRRFREAIYLEPSCWVAHFYLAEILFGQGERRRARSAYEAALKSLESGTLSERGAEFFPLFFNAAQFIAICRHKLSVLKEGRS